MSSECDSLEEVLPKPSPAEKYRFFNQPIEQIPGYKADKPQIIAHAPNCGLMWFTLDQCLPVVTCLKLEEKELKIERKKIVIIKDFDMEESSTDECPNIPVTSCNDDENDGSGEGYSSQDNNAESQAIKKKNLIIYGYLKEPNNDFNTSYLKSIIFWEINKIIYNIKIENFDLIKNILSNNSEMVQFFKYNNGWKYLIKAKILQNTEYFCYIVGDVDFNKNKDLIILTPFDVSKYLKININEKIILTI
jgi:hypothetical protein